MRSLFQHSQDDKEVYCSQHVPKTGPGKFDTDSVGIKLAMNAPKSAPYVNEQVRSRLHRIEAKEHRPTN